MTYDEITGLISTLIREKTTSASISPTDVSDAIQDVLDFANDSSINSVSPEDDYANDTDASAGGKGHGKLYHTSGILKINITP